MPITAKISPAYRWRIGIIGLGLLAFASWFMYDWAIGYPAVRHKQLTYQRIMTDTSLSGEQRQAKWVQTAAENGWSDAQPGKPKTHADIQTQLWYALPCLVLGLPIMGVFLMMGRRYLGADEEMVYDHRGRRARWAQINDIDKSRWRTKGIAAVYYHDADSGQTKKIILDDWKYQREPTQQILAHVEAQVYPEQAEGTSQPGEPDEAQVDTSTDNPDPAPAPTEPSRSTGV